MQKCEEQLEKCMRDNYDLKIENNLLKQRLRYLEIEKSHQEKAKLYIKDAEKYKLRDKLGSISKDITDKIKSKAAFQLPHLCDKVSK